MTGALQTFLQPGDAESWDALIRAAPDGHLLQSWAWGELKSRFGWRVQRVAVDGACAQVLYRPLPGGRWTLAYVPKGPAVDWRDPETPEALLDAIHPLAQRQRAVCLKVEPNGEDDPELARRLRSLGFRPSLQAVQPRCTILVDLEAGPDTLLERMKQKTRYNVRLAARKGVTVRRGGEADLPDFYRLMQATGLRDGFAVHSREYYEAAHRLIVAPGRGCLLLAEHEGRLLAGLVVMAFGRAAIYMYGASSDQARNLMPTYLLQWEAMLWAKRQGCRTYDLWGAPDADETTLEAQFEQRHDGLWGVYRFKRGFGGRLARSVGAWDLVYDRWRYRLYTLAVRWMNRKQAV